MLSNERLCLIHYTNSPTISNIKEFLTFWFNSKKESTNEVYGKMWRAMDRGGDEVMVTSNQAGIDKVLQEQGDYAFFMESTTIEYQTERDCRLQQIGGKLDSKSYGIALPQGSNQKYEMLTIIFRVFINIYIAYLQRSIFVR